MATSAKSLSEYVERWGLLFERSGLPRTAGRIWGWLLVCEPAAQSSQDLVGALRVTKGAVSTSTRLLEQAGIIERTGVVGSRQAYFRVREDAFEALVREKLEGTNRWLDLIREGLGILDQATPARRQRLAVLNRSHAFLQRELKRILDDWQARGQKR